MEYAIIPDQKAYLLSWTYLTPIGQWKVKRKEADGTEKCYTGVECLKLSESQITEVLKLGGLIFGNSNCILFWKYEYGVIQDEEIFKM